MDMLRYPVGHCDQGGQEITGYFGNSNFRERDRVIVEGSALLYNSLSIYFMSSQWVNNKG